MNTNTSEMIVTVAQVKAEPGAGILGHASDDEITQYIAGISQYWLQRTGQYSLSTTFNVSETYNGTGSYRLKVRNPPINSIASLQIGSCIIPAVTVPFVGCGYGIEDNGNFIYLRGYRFCKGIQNVGVTYNSGYNGAPADIIMAVVRHVALAYKRKDSINEKMLNLSGGGNTEFLNEVEITPDIERVIRLHSRLGM